MWTKYDYLCTDCDALYEITTLQTIPDCFEPECPCGSKNIVGLGKYDGNAPIFEPVTEITLKEVVKINTNPYN